MRTTKLPAHEALRAWRQATFDTQKAAASELGISQSYLSDLERGQLEPSADVALRIEERAGKDARRRLRLPVQIWRRTAA